MKQMKDTGSKTGYRTFTLEIPAHVWHAAMEEAKRDNNRPLGPTIVKMLERAIARRKAVAQ
jgi:hypothetical protein